MNRILLLVGASMKFLFCFIFLFFSLYAEEISCPSCLGVGVVECKKCNNGEMPCPDKCLKKEASGWKKMKVNGHPDTDLWMDFKVNGKYQVSYNQHHIGEVFVVENGKVISKGKCSTCKGTTITQCSLCSGTLKHSCNDCGGDGKMNEDENKKYKDKIAIEEKKNSIELVDGTIIKGTIVGSFGEKTLIKKITGEKIQIDTNQIKVGEVIKKEKEE